MTLFDVFSKREAGDLGLPEQVSDDDLLAWSEEIRSLPTDPDHELLVLGPAPMPAGLHLARRPLQATVTPEVPRRRPPLRARPLIAEPVRQLDPVSA